MNDVRQIRTDLILFFLCAVIVGIQYSSIVQALTWSRNIGNGRPRSGSGGSTNGVLIIATIRRRSCQIQFHPIGQDVSLDYTRSNAYIIGQGIGLAIDQGQRVASNCWYYIGCCIGGGLNHYIVIKGRAVDQIVCTRDATQVAYLYRIGYSVGAVWIGFWAYGYLVFFVRDVRQVAAGLIRFFGAIVIVGI